MTGLEITLLYLLAAVLGVVGCRLLKLPRLNQIKGTLIIVPIVNTYGFVQQSRYLPDRRDLNRSFPGSEKGSLGSRMAFQFTDKILKYCTHAIDLHTGAIHRSNLPQVRASAKDKVALRMAEVFNAPIIIKAASRDGTMRGTANNLGIPLLLYEAGEALRFDELSVRSGVNGVLNVMAHLGMIQPHPEATSITLPARCRRAIWVRAPRGGLCTLQQKSGDAVKKGEVIGRVAGIFGDDAIEFRAPIDGIIIGHAVLPVVNQGDALVHIAEVMRFGDVEQRVDQITEALLNDRLLDEDELI